MSTVSRASREPALSSVSTLPHAFSPVQHQAAPGAPILERMNGSLHSICRCRIPDFLRNIGLKIKYTWSYLSGRYLLDEWCDKGGAQPAVPHTDRECASQAQPLHGEI